MRNITWSVCVGLAAAMLVAAAPARASAQERAVDLGFGYSFLRIIPSEGDGTNLGAGWFASVGAQMGTLGIVGAVAGNYKTETVVGVDFTEKFHTFLAGPRVASRAGGPARVFGQLLVGATRVSISGGGQGESETDFTISPGAHVDIAVNRMLGIRVGGNLHIIRAKGDGSGHTWEKAFQAIAGIVVRPGQ